jgi:hypothetical protein
MLFAFILVILATWQAVEVWHHSSLFASARAYFEATDSALSHLLACPFCLSLWVGLACSAVSLLPPLPWVRLLLWPLAASRVANVLNDLLHPLSRTPRVTLSFPEIANVPESIAPTADFESSNS